MHHAACIPPLPSSYFSTTDLCACARLQGDRPAKLWPLQTATARITCEQIVKARAASAERDLLKLPQ
eukprot:6207896-Pleurochrysis_carterae.AAC.1